MSAETDTSGGSVSIGEGTQGAPEPTPTVSHDQQTASHPAGSSMPEGGVPIQERPEALVGGAFAGGMVVALLLRKIVG